MPDSDTDDQFDPADLPVKPFVCKEGHTWEARAAQRCPTCNAARVYIIEDGVKIPV